MKRLLAIFIAMIALNAISAQEMQRTYTPHYYDRCKLFDNEAPITSSDIVMLGNSLTENGKDWNKRLGTNNIRNRGIIGDEAMGVYDRLHQILPGKPKKIFLMIGVNDVSHDLTADSVVCLIGQLVDKIQKESPTTTLYLQSLLPINENKSKYKTMIGKTLLIPQINDKLQVLCYDKGITFINLFPLFTEGNTYVLREELTRDGLHIIDEGYDIWSKGLAEYID